jgi:FtsP/CotA-like multicopper oxidase with cupredoxin domain
VQEPPELSSRNGLLEVTFHFKYQVTLVGQGPPRYCYITGDGMQSPTLRLHPGDRLIIHFHNDLRPAELSQAAQPPSAAHDLNSDCNATTMNGAMTNLHFHGLSVPPTCHQDDVLHTAIPPGGDFDYRLTIPRDEPPGLYWYHPHPHGFSERQVQGGASGALIVEGLDQVFPWLAKLPQRVLVLRDQPLSDTLPSNGTNPAWDISINYVPVTHPTFPPATILARVSQRELWRVVNAGADTFFNLQVLAGGVPQPLQVVAIDGVPVTHESAWQNQSTVPLPPGARAEFVVETPKAGERAQLVTEKWDTGPQGDSDPARPIANIVSRSDVPQLASLSQAESTPAPPRPWQPPSQALGATVQRTLYFSQFMPNSDEADADGDASVFYYITVLGQKPAMYHMGQKPNIVVHQGDVEDWIIQNRAPEEHVFHIHQMHFRVLEVDGKPVHDHALRDAVDLPYWSGSGPSPSVKLRMDFRDPNTVGTFLYHCHILKHEDMGMMGVIQVLPPGLPTVTTLTAPARSATNTLLNILATVAGKNGKQTAPSGTVQFNVDGATSRPVPITQGKARFTISFDAPGPHVITAAYAGDSIYDESISRPLKLQASQ